MVLIASNELKPISTDEFFIKNDEDDASITATNCNREGPKVNNNKYI